jgi:hypothetical protein
MDGEKKAQTKSCGAQLTMAVPSNAPQGASRQRAFKRKWKRFQVSYALEAEKEDGPNFQLARGLSKAL